MNIANKRTFGKYKSGYLDSVVRRVQLARDISRSENTSFLPDLVCGILDLLIKREYGIWSSRLDEVPKLL